MDIYEAYTSFKTSTWHPYFERCDRYYEGFRESANLGRDREIEIGTQAPRRERASPKRSTRSYLYNLFLLRR